MNILDIIGTIIDRLVLICVIIVTASSIFFQIVDAFRRK